MTPAVQLLDALSVLRRQWRQRVLLESAVWIAVAALLAVLGGQLITTIAGATTASVLVMRGLAYTLVILAIARFLVIPLMRRASDERFALYVEERAPELRQALLSAVQELRLPEDERSSPSLTARLVERTLTKVRPLQTGATLERPRMLRAGRALGVIALGAGLLFFAGPAALRRTARVLFAPWSVAEAAVPVLAVRVHPGNAAIPRGAAVDVRASLVGFAAEGAELVFRADSSSQWVRLPMSRDSLVGEFTSRMFDLTRPTEYYVDANGVRSAVYRFTVTDLPTVKRLALDLKYPSYTGLPVEHIDDGGDVAAVVGTTVTVHASMTRAVRSGTLTFDNGETVPFVVGQDGRLSASFRVRTNRFYRVDLVAADGAKVPGSVQYAIEALADRKPTIRIDEPGRDTKVTNVEEVTIAVSASDDYGVESLELRYSVNGGAEKTVALADSGRRRAKEPRAAHTLFLEELTLTPGDLITYHAVARDGAGNEALSDVYFLEVRPFGKNYRQAEQQGGGGGDPGASPDGLVARQREVVAGTFNWLRDSAATSDRKRREDITTLNIAEGRLREDVAALSRKIAERGAAKLTPMFGKIKTELDSAVVSLQAAEENLLKAAGRDALPSEQKALQHLQRAEALYLDVQVQMGGGGGAGGGGPQKAEDLADLFELQTDKMRNQYEAVQKESQQSAQRQVDATLERLKQLAARQQQENERMQRKADAMREKLGRDASGGGGGGGSQRELAREAEEEARRLERLAREQKSKDLEDAAQRMQQAADAMRKAATGSSAQGSAAADQLRRAASGLENARSAGVSEDVRKLAQQAKDLQDREKDIASGVQGLRGMTAPYQRADQIRKLNERKDALAKDVEKLETDADRLSREGRREQPAASGKLNEVSEAIRDRQLRPMIDYSKSVIRSGSSDYANAFENQIGTRLADVEEKTRAAANALSAESASRGQERSLEQARELIRGLESLRERVGDRVGQKGANQGRQDEKGKLSSGDARQFAREFGLRRQNAEALRDELQKQGVDVAVLNGAIEELRRLESGRRFSDPRGLEELQSQLIDGLKTYEFSLYRRLGLGDEKSPTLGTRAPVPSEYRAAVEEYYRSLAAGRRKP